MAEIDPVVLQLLADTNRYRSELRATTRTVDEQLGAQERRVKRLESEFRQSSGAIGNTLRGLAGVLAGAFTGRELVGLLDSFTRLQNSLRVAGLEGQALGAVQGKLLDLSTRYGVSIEELAGLYGRSSQAASDLGASEAQLLQVTEASAQALKITGTSAVQAQGALLGLVQALASGTVRAEEFNQINEGGLRPLLQVAANTERFGGSVAKLRIAVTDGKLSSQEFFNAILAGSAELEGRASKATLTLSGAFEALSSQLVVYFGEAGQASGVTEALASAIKGLADNLDVIIPALATIAGIMGASFLVNVGRAAVSTVALSAAATGAAGSMGLMGAASFALQARLAGAATTTEALTFATRGLAGAIAATGIGALIVALGYLASQAESTTAFVDRLAASTGQLRDENDRMVAAMRQAGASVDGLGSAASGATINVDNLNTSMGRAIGTALNLVAALNQAGIAEAAMRIGQNRLQRDQLANPNIANGPAALGDAIANWFGLNNERIAALDAENRELSRGLNIRIAAAKQGVDIKPGVAAPVGGGGSSSVGRKSRAGGSGGRSGPSGPSAEEIADRFNSELTSLAQQTLSAQARIAQTVEERAELELRGVELARLRTLNDIEANADYSEAQKARLTQQVEALADAERENIELARRAEIERNAQDLADERARAEADGLRLQYELADTDAERRAIAFKILEAEQAYLKSKLRAVIESKTASLAEKERAQAALTALEGMAAGQYEAVRRQNQGALGAYAQNAKDFDGRVESLVAQKMRDINDTISNTIAKELGIKDDFLAGLLSIFLDKVLFGPLAESLSSAASGNGFGDLFGSIAGAFGSLFGGGRASGGFVNSGKMYRVNEGASPGRVEGFMPTGSGKIIPLGQMNAVQAGGGSGGGVVVVRLALSGDIDAKIDQRAANVAVEVTRQAAPQIVDAAANETQRRFSRPSL